MTRKTLTVRSIAQWRAWLAKHHQSESEVWLVFHKKHTGAPSVEYGDALDEALCFGWVDSLVKRLDDARYARKFTPRKPESVWSAVNRKRYAALEASGRLTQAGIDRSPTGKAYPTSQVSPARPTSAIPPYIQEMLNKHPAARTYFESLAPSYRRNYVLWIDTAKQDETKMRRLREAIELLSAGKKLGLK